MMVCWQPTRLVCPGFCLYSDLVDLPATLPEISTTGLVLIGGTALVAVTVAQQTKTVGPRAVQLIGGAALVWGNIYNIEY